MQTGKLLFHIISGILGLFLAAKLVPGVEFYGTFLMLIIVGLAIGLINFYIRPFLKAISFPIRMLTLGIFSLVINMAIIWFIEIIFPRELEITGLMPLFWTTLIIWALNFFFGTNNPKKIWKK
jgi:putative membrane protein